MPPTAARRRSVRGAVAAELARAAGAALLLPIHAAGYLARRAEHEARARAALATSAPPATDPELAAPPARPLAIALACAERSGEIHAASLARALSAALAERGAPPPLLWGLGGEHLAQAGVELVARPVERARMGVGAALAGLPYYLRLLAAAAQRLCDAPPDVLVLVDSPALHVPLARIARSFGVPTVHFVAPQYWGWAPWRVAGYRRAVDRVLTILPFEPAWFTAQGIDAVHVGHPLLDALADVPRGSPGAERRNLVLLPGSRRGVVARNLPWMLDIASRAARELGGAPLVAVAADGEREVEIEAIVRASGAAVRVARGDLHAELAAARAAFSVSGTVLVDLLHQRLPAVVAYRLGGPLSTGVADRFLSVPWFASVNLLAGREVFPEFRFHGAGPRDAVARALVDCYKDEGGRERCRAGLDLAAERLGPPGAIRRAALQVLDLALSRLAPTRPAWPTATKVPLAAP